jgi:hypothetical protein
VEKVCLSENVNHDDNTPSFQHGDGDNSRFVDWNSMSRYPSFRTCSGGGLPFDSYNTRGRALPIEGERDPKDAPGLPDILRLRSLNVEFFLPEESSAAAAFGP